MKNIIFGRVLGMALLLVGVILFALGIALALETDSIFVILTISPVFILLGISMIIFPGAKMTLHEVHGDVKFMEILKDKSKQAERQAREFMCIRQAPLLHKIVWGLSFTAGITVMTFTLIMLMV